MSNILENPNIVPSGYRILYVLFLLINNSLSQKEINEKLSQNPDIEQSFTKETLLKIMNTLKVSDVKISKKKNKYYISKLPWQIYLDSKHLKTLAALVSFVESLEQKELSKNYNSFLENFSRFLPDDNFLDLGLETSSYKNVNKYCKHSLTIKKIEQFRQNTCRIKTILNGGHEYFFDTYHIEYASREVLLTGYSLKHHENKTVNLDEIKSIKELPQKSSGVFFPSSVTFKIKGRLAKSYNLRENEKLLNFDKDELVISNKGEDRQKFFRRILKYKDLCEIVTSEIIRSDFKKMLEGILQNYQKP
ncbi:MAG: hypothetical protein WCF95_04655 [bacterium]